MEKECESTSPCTWCSCTSGKQTFQDLGSGVAGQRVMRAAGLAFLCHKRLGGVRALQLVRGAESSAYSQKDVEIRRSAW